MSITYLIPVKFKCDMPGCHNSTVAVCACAEDSENGTLSPDGHDEPKLPQGWVVNDWGGHWCGCCASLQESKP